MRPQYASTTAALIVSDCVHSTKNEQAEYARSFFLILCALLFVFPCLHQIICNTAFLFLRFVLCLVLRKSAFSSPSGKKLRCDGDGHNSKGEAKKDGFFAQAYGI
jgi:hypothetical protein